MWQACDKQNEHDPPKFSLANGIDFGVLSRLPEYQPLSEMEIMALSDIRLYHITVKVRCGCMLTTGICSSCSQTSHPARRSRIR